MSINAKQYNLVRHAIGLDGRSKTTYRNHYVCPADSEDGREWMDLVKQGLAHHRKGSEISGGDDVFWATRETALACRKKDEHLDRDFRE